MGGVLLLAAGSAVFPALLAGAAVLLSRDRPEWLLVAFWLGGFITSVTAGVLIISLFGESSASLSSGGGSSLSPVHSIVIGVLVLAIAALIGTRRGEALIAGWRRRREVRKASHGHKRHDDRPPWTERVLGNGSVTIAAVAGAVLNLPGPFYLIALGEIAKAHHSFPVDLGTIVLFNLVMLTLVEVPIIGYLVAPDRTDRIVGVISAWLNRNGIRIVAMVALIGSLVLVGKGVHGLVQPGKASPSRSSAAYPASSRFSSVEFGKNFQTSAAPSRTSTIPTV